MGGCPRQGRCRRACAAGRLVVDDRADRRAQAGRHGHRQLAAAGAGKACRRQARIARRSLRTARRWRSRRRSQGVGAYHCRGIRQGRRRQVDDGAQPRAGIARSGLAGRRARCGYLRPVDAEADGNSREAAAQRRQAHDSDRALRTEGHVDRLPRRGRDADDLARADGDVGDHADAQGSGVGHARRDGGGHAAGHG